VVQRLFIGIDVGSTTVKCVVMDPGSLEILWSRYQRHETHQPEVTAEMLTEIEADFPDLAPTEFRAFITGSGAGPLAPHIGARFVQEVNAVAIAVEQRHPDVYSVVELGGQDAKIILFSDAPESEQRRIVTSMNDKCASGTGATIDKCMIKVGMPESAMAGLEYDPQRLHKVAARCGVFAETDIVNLIKAGVPSDEVMNSLADAIVMQNLTVLTRGNTLRERVLLLGGPNTFLPFLQDCWRLRIGEIWDERGYQSSDRPMEELVYVPEDSQFYAALGAALFGMQEGEDAGVYKGLAELQEFIRNGRKAKLGANSGPALVAENEDFDSFRKFYAIPEFTAATFEPGQTVRGYIGFDGGSTSSKAVLIDEDGEILAKGYLLSKGNPVQDAKDIMADLKRFVTDQGARLELLGFGVTGYATDVLNTALNADAAVVETVAHMLSAQKYCGEDIDVICDIGGQDIKVLFMQNGVIKSFRLSNQCSAGNGMLLQSMAGQFNVDIRDFADNAFKAEISPNFSYGCAVFLDADRVNFQKEGYNREELFAGLARVLPKNVWQYVVQIPRMAELGTKYVLQGGTQHNLAAVKSQVDYIKERVPGAVIRIHPHTGEAGAIGAALEARRMVERRGHSVFVGLDSAIGLKYTTRTDEETRCTFCANNCPRTFIDTETPEGQTARYIAGFSCEKGTVESKEAVQELNRQRKKLKEIYPDLVDYEAELAFRHFYDPEPMPEDGAAIEREETVHRWFGWGKARRQKAVRPFRRSAADKIAARENIRIGIPRVLNSYVLGPFLRTYLESLGIGRRNVVFSDETSEELWAEGGKYGSIDPCFPSKVAQAHLHDLIMKKNRRKQIDYIWFPSITDMPSFVTNTMGNATCPIVAGTPQVIYASFTKEKDYFAENGISFVGDPLNFLLPHLLRRQLFETWGRLLDITEAENEWACEQAWKALEICDDELQRRGLELLTDAEQNNGIVLLMLARPYHNDPGLNHKIFEEFQALGYPVISIRSIPKDPAWLERFFADDLEAGLIDDVFDVRDVWPENYSVNSVQKVWAAKFAARHPNVGVVDLSSFKCGHDAPTYGLIDSIISATRTPYLALHDLDANKPGGSIGIRVKTYAYALELYKDEIADKLARRNDLEKAVAARRAELVEKYRAELEQHINETGGHAAEGLAAAFEAYVNGKEAEQEPAENERHVA
jgi:activator of 2-hydroxyglutaryl-CoA dehydratase/predicted nucleotide-binding protein (sugar kinase/HSP70/actin superfamily)